MVAVNGGGHGDFGKPGGHELEERHLGGCVLHGDPVGMEVGVAVATFECLVRWVGEVIDKNFLRQCQRPIETVAADLDVARQGGVDTLDEFDGGGCTHRSHTFDLSRQVVDKLVSIVIGCSDE